MSIGRCSSRTQPPAAFRTLGAMEQRRIDPLQRQYELLLLLLGSDSPRTRQQIADVVHGYPADPDSMRKQLRRDLDVLEAEGVPVRLTERDNEWFYEVRRDEFYLPELGLTWEEQSALELALTAVRVGEGAPESVLHKLNAELHPSEPLLLALPTGGVLPVLMQARDQRAEVTFTYSGKARRLGLWDVMFQRGHWYAVGWDHGYSEQRTYRADRIDGEARIAAPGTVQVPADFDARTAIPNVLQFVGDAPVEAELRIDAVMAPAVPSVFGRDATVEPKADGAVTVQVTVTHRGAFRSTVLGLLDHAEVLGPPELRAEMVRWLEALAAQR